MITLFGAALIISSLNFVVALAEILLGLRILLRLLAANPAAPFVNWVYDMSEPLLAPFANMFPSPTLEEGAVLEFSAIFAVIIYALIDYLLVELVHTIDERSAEIKRKSS